MNKPHRALLHVLLAICAISLVSCGGETTTNAAGSGTAGTTTPPTTPGSSGSGNTNSRSANLSWVAPATNTDGSTVLDLAGYRIYYGTSPGNYSNTLTVNSSTSNYLVENLSPGTWYFAVAAFDTSANESSKSAEVSKTIN